MSAALTNMALVFGLVQVAQKFNLDAPENEFYLRLSYGFVQFVSFCLLAWIYYRITSKNDQTALSYTESKNPFDKKDVEVINTTVAEYDTKQLQMLLFQSALGICIVLFMHLKWGYLRPLLLQSVLGFRTLFSTPIVRVYVLGATCTGELQRPWKAPGSLGQQVVTPKELKQMEKKEQKKKINRLD